jgi:hypothetical protein
MLVPVLAVPVLVAKPVPIESTVLIVPDMLESVDVALLDVVSPPKPPVSALSFEAEHAPAAANTAALNAPIDKSLEKPLRELGRMGDAPS